MQLHSSPIHVRKNVQILAWKWIIQIVRSCSQTCHKQKDLNWKINPRFIQFFRKIQPRDETSSWIVRANSWGIQKFKRKIYADYPERYSYKKVGEVFTWVSIKVPELLSMNLESRKIMHSDSSCIHIYFLFFFHFIINNVL